MRRSLLASLALLSLAAPARAQQPPPKKPVDPTPSPDVCTHVRGSVRQEAYGYTHVVSVHNGCPRPVSCQVWSDVDPEPKVSVSLSPGQATEIVTRRGSPARELTGLKKCSFR